MHRQGTFKCDPVHIVENLLLTNALHDAADPPQDAGFISVGYVAGLGAVVYRGGSLIYWSNDHNPTTIPLVERPLCLWRIRDWAPLLPFAYGANSPSRSISSRISPMAR